MECDGLGGPDPYTLAIGDGVIAEGEDELEWETVGDDGKGAAAVPSGPLGSSFMADATGIPRPADWRERMKTRQKFWSQSHGFKVHIRTGYTSAVPLIGLQEFGLLEAPSLQYF